MDEDLISQNKDSNPLETWFIIIFFRKIFKYKNNKVFYNL